MRELVGTTPFRGLAESAHALDDERWVLGFAELEKEELFKLRIWTSKRQGYVESKLKSLVSSSSMACAFPMNCYKSSKLDIGFTTSLPVRL